MKIINDCANVSAGYPVSLLGRDLCASGSQDARWGNVARR